MALARHGHTATLLLSGTVLIAGGGDGNIAVASAELFDPAGGTFTATGGMSAARLPHGDTVGHRGLLIAGGYGGSDGYSLASAELYQEIAHSHVELEVDHVAVAHDVFLAFDGQLGVRAAGGLGAAA